MPLLIYFMFFLFYLAIKRHKSIAIGFVIVHIVSLAGAMVIGANYPVKSFFDFFNLCVTAVILTLIILPWMKINNIYNISAPKEAKVRRLTYVILLASVIPFITFFAVSIFVFMYVDDINTFKYAEGVSTEFYYNLPINVKLFILSNHLYYLSYFLIPLHFYYLSRRNFKLSLICFIFSLNILLYGLTYFSRAVFIHYSFIYIAMLFMLFKTMDLKIQKYVKRAVIILGLFFSVVFINLTNARFAKDNFYIKFVRPESYIQDPVLYSYFDYLSQWYYNSMFVLSSYDFKTFTGQISLQSVLGLLSHFGLLEYNVSDYMNLRQTLWPLHWYMFNGFVAYSVFDYGYFLTIIFALVYCYIICKLRPDNNCISLTNLFLMVLLIQLPLMAIFYSTVGGLMIPFLLVIPIYSYLRVRWI